MSESRLEQLVSQLKSGQIDRRTFTVRCAAAGISVLAAGSALGRASAQDASPAASPAGDELTPENLGVPGVPHNTDTTAGTINLYSSWPMTAASEQIGGDSAAAVAFAVEVWGAAAGGFAINYQALDDGVAASNGAWDATKEAENATLVINDPDAVLYIGTYNSGAAEVSIPLMNEAGMAMVSPANTAVRLTKENPSNPEGYPEILYPTGIRNYFRVVPADDLQGAAAANWAFNTKGATNAFVLHDKQVYGEGVAAVFRDTFESLGGTIASFEGFNPDAEEYRSLVTKIANSGADLVYLGAIVNLNASKLLLDLREVVSADEVVFLGPDGLVNQAFVDAAGDAAAGAFITFAGLPAQELTGVGKAWYDTFKASLGHEPDAYSIYSFDCGVVALQAIEQVGKDRAAVIENLAAVEGFRGLLGTWDFSDTGDTTLTTVSLNEVIDGQISFQETISPPE
jgi:branched-chain amino acid transport system substrate-binding protein